MYHYLEHCNNLEVQTVDCIGLTSSYSNLIIKF